MPELLNNSDSEAAHKVEVGTMTKAEAELFIQAVLKRNEDRAQAATEAAVQKPGPSLLTG